MYDLLKTICTTNSYEFQYARKDFHNLFESELQVGDTTPVVFLDPVQITENLDEYSKVESTTYDGQFMILLSSDIDEEDYDYRYQTYIKPTITTTLATIRDAIVCDATYTILTWRSIEVINAFDFNADGVIITYSING